MVGVVDTDSPVLHLIYDTGDTMIDNVKKIVFEHEEIDIISGIQTFLVPFIKFWRVDVKKVTLLCIVWRALWLLCIAMMLSFKMKVMKFQELHHTRINEFWWIKENASNGFLKFQLIWGRHKLNFGSFSSGSEYFNQPHVIDTRMYKEPISWWANHGSLVPL